MCPFLIVSTCVFFCPFSGGMYGMPPLMDRYGLGMPIGPATMVCCKDYSILGLETPETCNPLSYFFVHDKWSKYQVVLWLLSRSFWPFFFVMISSAMHFCDASTSGFQICSTFTDQNNFSLFRCSTCTLMLETQTDGMLLSYI